jgi:hypothetical protein
MESSVSPETAMLAADDSMSQHTCRFGLSEYDTPRVSHRPATNTWIPR